MNEACQKLMRDRAVVFKLLAAIYRDEVPEDLIKKMQAREFATRLESASGEGLSAGGAAGIKRLVDLLSKTDGAAVFKDACYDYAELFLNAGVAPVFIYESVYAKGEPVVMQEPVFRIRKCFREAGVHKAEDYRDLDDHIAVEFEFIGWLSEKIAGGQSGLLKLMVDFEREHLTWVAGFCEDLAKYAQSNFYKAMAEITAAVVSGDQEILDALEKETLPAQQFVKALSHLADAARVLELGDGYVTIKEGIKEPLPVRQVKTHCYLCGALCGMVATVDDGILTKVEGLPGDPKSDGVICTKGVANPSHCYSAYRLKCPLIKENGRFRKATWDEALDRVGKELMSREPSVVGFLRGNDYNNWLTEAVFKAYGAPSTTHRPMCDNAIRMANEHNLNDKRPWIDYKASDYIIHWGYNHRMTAYGRRQVTYFKDAMRKGAKLVDIDVRRSETARFATEWIAPRPGTDPAMAMAMCYVIVKEGLYNKEFVQNWTYGFEDFKKRLLGEEDGVVRTPEWAEKISGVPAGTIERIAREFAAAEHPATICWTGVSQSINGFYGTQAVHALNGLVGSFDAPGGPCLPFKRKLKSAWGDHPKPPAQKPPKLDKLKMWEGWAPSYFPRDVDQGKIKALVCYWGSPVLSWTNQQAAIDAIKKLEFVVTIDAFMNNTATLSDVVIPSVSSLEMDSLRADWMYEAFLSSFQRAIDPLYDCRPEWWIFIELAKRLGLGEYFPWTDIEEALRNMLKGTPWDYDELKDKGFIITDNAEYFKYRKWGSFNTPTGYGSSGKTITGKYNFKNPIAEQKGIDPLPDYKDPRDEYPELVPDEKYPLILVNFRLFSHEHSSTMNNTSLMNQVREVALWINSEDAAQRGIGDGDKVSVESPWGKVTLGAFVTKKIRAGVVGAPGGFGHWRGMEADPRFVKSQWVNTAGSLLPPNKPDKYGGNPLLKYIKVDVCKL